MKVICLRMRTGNAVTSVNENEQMDLGLFSDRLVNGANGHRRELQSCQHATGQVYDLTSVRGLRGS